MDMRVMMKAVDPQDIVYRYWDNLPAEMRKIAELLDHAISANSQSERSLSELHAEIHRMSGAALCMGYQHIGRKLEKMETMLDDLRSSEQNNASKKLKSITELFASVARIRQQTSPLNSSLLSANPAQPAVDSLLQKLSSTAKDRQETLADQRILFADDDLSTRMLMREILVSLGIPNVATVASGTELLDLSRQFQPSIIISDWYMEPLNGLELLKIIRNGETRIPSDIRIVFLTSKNTLGHLQEAADAGVSHFLVKPFSTRQVQVALTTVLTQQRSDELSDILD